MVRLTPKLSKQEQLHGRFNMLLDELRGELQMAREHQVQGQYEACAEHLDGAAMISKRMADTARKLGAL